MDLGGGGEVVFLVADLSCHIPKRYGIHQLSSDDVWEVCCSPAIGGGVPSLPRQRHTAEKGFKLALEGPSKNSKSQISPSTELIRRTRGWAGGLDLLTTRGARAPGRRECAFPTTMEVDSTRSSGSETSGYESVTGVGAASFRCFWDPTFRSTERTHQESNCSRAACRSPRTGSK